MHNRNHLRENNKELPDVGTAADIIPKDHDYCAQNGDNKSGNDQHNSSTTNGIPKRMSDIETAATLTDDLSTATSDSAAFVESADLRIKTVDENFESPQKVFPSNTSDYRFECICGGLQYPDLKDRVQCLQCDLWQHAECVNYKKENVDSIPFYCPHCLVAMKPVPTRATLIISPSSICHQWVDEINRHVRSSSLQVMVRDQNYLVSDFFFKFSCF